LTAVTSAGGAQSCSIGFRGVSCDIEDCLASFACSRYEKISNRCHLERNFKILKEFSKSAKAMKLNVFVKLPETVR
jgi:hypothetical protein